MSGQIPRYLAKRFVSAIPVLVLVSFTIVALVRLVPGGPAVAMLGTDADPEQIEAVRRSMGLHQPLYIQYLEYLAGVLRLDLGYSHQAGQPVSAAIAQRLPVTMTVAAGGLMVSLLISIPAGAIGAIKQGTPYDYAALTIGLVGLSIPGFWLGIMLLLVFSIRFGIFPVVGYVSPFSDPLRGLKYLVLPSISIGTAMAAITTRMLRSSMLDEIRREYVAMHRMKGMSDFKVYGHTMRNAFIPVITIIGLQVGYLLGGTVVTEEVFTIPGMGRLLVNSIHSRDYAMIQGILLVYTSIFIFVNIAVDVTYHYFDPKISEL